MKMRCVGKVACLSLLVTMGCFGAGVEKLKSQERAKREQLYVLGEKIKKLEEDLIVLRKKLVEFAPAIIASREKKFLSENPGKQFSEKDRQDALSGEGQRFMASFFDVTRKEAGCIVGDEFFGGVENGAAYKFYLIKYFYDTYTLHELFSEWEKLSDEMVAVSIQISSFKGV